MASKKSAATVDREVSQSKTKAATAAELTKLLRGADSVNAKLRIELAEAQAEISRKEAWINRYAEQLKAARKRLATAPDCKPVSERRAAMIAAREEAMRTGKSVAVTL